MKLKRHQADSIQWELKQQGLATHRFPTHIPCSSPSKGSRIAQATCMFQAGKEHLLYYDEGGAFLNNRLFSPYECVFIDDLPYLRPKVLGSINVHIPLKTLAAFLISADIVRTYIDVESIMILEQVHSKMINVHGYYVYYDPDRQLVPFGFSIVSDQFQHISICRHSLAA